ncbi:MAG TPA: carbonic anhydrase family protein [Thermoanaerobaculia bacterium]|nr:carbonic anhydrase family protein [Thermoanaerobaculia bacterium]
MHKLAIAAALLLAVSPLPADECNPNWGYTGRIAPEYWGEHYPLCAAGLRQSPIDIRTSGRTPDPGLRPVEGNRQQESRFNVERRAYDLEVKDLNPAWTLSWQGRTATLLQFHFHVKAEHYLNGHQPEAEAHFVFKENGRNNLIVVAVWIKAGAENEALQKIIRLKPAECKQENPSGKATIKMNDFLQRINVNHYATYEGSLTTPTGSLTTPTPTCEENVTFIVMLEPIQALASEINALKIVQDPPGNVRPLQTQGMRLRH